MRLRLAADAVVLSEHHASQVPRFGGLNALAAEVLLLRRDLERLRSQMAGPTAAERPAPAPEGADGGDPASWPAERHCVASWPVEPLEPPQPEHGAGEDEEMAPTAKIAEPAKCDAAESPAGVQRPEDSVSDGGASFFDATMTDDDVIGRAAASAYIDAAESPSNHQEPEDAELAQPDRNGLRLPELGEGELARRPAELHSERLLAPELGGGAPATRLAEPHSGQPDPQLPSDEPGPPPARCIACHGTGYVGWGPCHSCSGGSPSLAIHRTLRNANKTKMKYLCV